VTHDDHLAGLADRVVRMSDGSIEADDLVETSPARAVSP
jgi:putative ABC transport system ATP-binding protein